MCQDEIMADLLQDAHPESGHMRMQCTEFDVPACNLHVSCTQCCQCDSVWNAVPDSGTLRAGSSSSILQQYHSPINAGKMEGNSPTCLDKSCTCKRSSAGLPSDGRHCITAGWSTTARITFRAMIQWRERMERWTSMTMTRRARQAAREA